MRRPLFDVTVRFWNRRYIYLRRIWYKKETFDYLYLYIVWDKVLEGGRNV